MKIALIHDWLTGMRGGEYVLEAILEIFPDADLYTLIDFPEKLSPALQKPRRFTSFLQKIPGIEKSYRYFLPLMPFAISRFDMSEYDLIISSSHCVAKGVRKSENAVHISYIHAPMRYVWDRFEDYFGKGKASLLARIVATLIRAPLQNWDRKVSQPARVDALITNSRFIADQVRAAYGRDSRVIHPFVDFGRFSLNRDKKDYYLMVGAFAPNKRVDLAIEAFNQLNLKLVIIGSGQDEKRLKQQANANIQFLGAVSNAEIAKAFSEARAFIFPGLEDFGITPLESMAAGLPVIAYGAGGVLDSVTEETGLFFNSQTVNELKNAVLEFEKNPNRLEEQNCRQRAREFSKTKFQESFIQVIRETFAKRKLMSPPFRPLGSVSANHLR